MPFPKDHIQGEDDCFRCSLACYLDMHPSRVKYFSPDWDDDSESMWPKYRNWIMERTGLYMAIFDSLEAINVFLGMNKKWIAIVPSLRYSKDLHAIVMKGDKLFYDPNGQEGRKQKPHKFSHAIILADDFQENEDGYVTFTY